MYKKTNLRLLCFLFNEDVIWKGFLGRTEKHSVVLKNLIERKNYVK